MQDEPLFLLFMRTHVSQFCPIRHKSCVNSGCILVLTQICKSPITPALFHIFSRASSQWPVNNSKDTYLHPAAGRIVPPLEMLCRNPQSSQNLSQTSSVRYRAFLSNHPTEHPQPVFICSLPPRSYEQLLLHPAIWDAYCVLVHFFD